MRLSERTRVPHSCPHLAGLGEVSPLPSICLKVYLEDLLPKPVFTFFCNRLYIFFYSGHSLYINFTPSLATTDTLSPSSHGHQNCSDLKQLSCILELALSPLLSSSDVLRLKHRTLGNVVPRRDHYSSLLVFRAFSSVFWKLVSRELRWYEPISSALYPFQ